MKLRLSHLLVFFMLAGCIFAISSCITPPNYPVEPEIEFVSFSRTHVYGQLDSIRAIISFTDGDGDLGFKSNDSFECTLCDTSCLLADDSLSIYVSDTREGCFVPYFLPYIPPKGSSEAISGKIDIVISSICCIYPDNTGCVPSTEFPRDTVIYSVQIKDRKGNFSNKLFLPPVILHCDGQ